MKQSAVTDRMWRWFCGGSLLALLGCASGGSFEERDVDTASSEAVAQLVSTGELGLELDALQTEWRSSAFQIGRLKFEAESNGERLDLNVALASVLDRLPDDARGVWVDSLGGIVADPDGSSGSRLQRELIATAIVLANDADLAEAFAAQVGESIEPSETSLTEIGGVDLLRTQGAIISRISDGEADAERLAG